MTRMEHRLESSKQSCLSYRKTRFTMTDKDKYLPLSFSSLKAFDRSPLAFVHYKEGPRKETDAMRFGTMVHRAVLEPDKYQATVAVYDGRRGTNAHKEFMLENAHKDVLTVKEAATVRSISDSVLNHTLRRSAATPVHRV